MPATLLIKPWHDPVVDTLIEHANRIQSPFSVVVLEPKGGAIDRVDEDAVAVPGRGAACAFYGIAQWEIRASRTPTSPGRMASARR